MPRGVCIEAKMKVRIYQPPNVITAIKSAVSFPTELTLAVQSITFEASDRSRSLPLALIHILASELSLAPIREIAR